MNVLSAYEWNDREEGNKINAIWLRLALMNCTLDIKCNIRWKWPFSWSVRPFIGYLEVDGLLLCGASYMVKAKFYWPRTNILSHDDIKVILKEKDSDVSPARLNQTRNHSQSICFPSVVLVGKRRNANLCIYYFALSICTEIFQRIIMKCSFFFFLVRFQHIPRFWLLK